MAWQKVVFLTTVGCVLTYAGCVMQERWIAQNRRSRDAYIDSEVKRRLELEKTENGNGASSDKPSSSQE
ncbi:hypothetical protein BLSTO_04671 [Blastocystis sp. subtype 1]